MSWRRRAAVLPLVVVAVLLGAPAPANAHPLGNASVNHYDGLRLFNDHVEDVAVEDVAEIPTYQRRKSIDADADGSPSTAERSAYADRQCGALASSVRLRVGGSRTRFTVTAASYTERASTAVPGLSVGRLECRLTAKADLTEPTTIDFRNDWDGAGIGWHEITAVGKGVSLKNSPVPPRSISDTLRSYPDDLLSNPLDVRRVALHTEPGPGRSTYQAAKDIPVAGFFVRQLARLADTFTGLVGSKHLTLGVGVLAVIVALALGAGHAMLPGHGKTIMAAYVVGKKGRLRDVVAVGATVTLTHTAGVLVLGLLLTSSTAFAPTAIEQVLGAVSGLIIIGVGIALVVNGVRRRAPRRLTSELAELDVQVRLASVGAEQPTTAGASTDSDGRRSLRAEVTSAHAVAGAPPARPEPLTGGPVPADESEGHAHGHEHAHGHSHSHGHSHGHGHGHVHGGETGFSRGGLLGLGIAGGLVPSPSALVVLLGAITLGRTVFGVLLVLAYGIGMAATLSGAALILVRIRDRVGRVGAGSRFRRFERFAAWGPVLTAVLVIVVGIGVTLRAVSGVV